MTTKEKLIKMCVVRGMFENNASEVVEQAILKIDNMGGDKISWNGPAYEYPDHLYAAMFLTVADCAIKWIERNCPLAFYKDMFLQ